ncbi:MAG: DUF2851 family protein [Nitrospinae bacterium]|nr:DUF2851 family protein [Nitrospinota bacterium]
MVMSELHDPLPLASCYRHLWQAVWHVDEPRAPYRPASTREAPTERLLHILWLQQGFLRQPLRTLDHRIVTIHRPGRWNRGSGPDFLEAKLRFDDGRIRVGAVEVHVRASDWAQHGHACDPAYTDVLLHVVWWNDLPDITVMNAHGTRIPQLEVASFLDRPLADLQETIDVEGFVQGRAAEPTRCQRSLQEMPPETIGWLLDMAGEERLRQKASRLALKVDRRGVEQALYEWVLEALGFKGNRLPFWELARWAPIARLRSALASHDPTPLRLQAILFGVSGFLTRWQADLTTRSRESRTYVEQLWSLWEPMARLFPEQLGERQWRTAGIRPANFPPRRIAAAAYLLEGMTQDTLMDIWLAPLRALHAATPPAGLLQCQRDLVQRLRVAGASDFWQRHYTLDGVQLSRPADLVGSGRAATLVIDVLLPAALALAELGQESISPAAIRALYRRHPRLPSNELTREMMRQFFGADRLRASVVNSACRQQALIQLYRDFCVNEQETCQECAFPRLAARLAALPNGSPPGSA